MNAPSSERILAVTGLKHEARIVGMGMENVLIGGDGKGLAERLDRVVAERRCAILSIGIAGGIEPGLAPGTVIAASSVCASGRHFHTTKAWTENLGKILFGVHMGVVAGESRIVASAADKSALHRATGALAVDMESHIAAEIAHAHRAPFAVLRVIADPAERSLPTAARSALLPDGSVSVARMLMTLAATPTDLVALIRTALDAQTAFQALARCCRLAGPCFCLPDVGELLLDVS